MASRIYGRWLLHGYTNSDVGMEFVAVRNNNSYCEQLSTGLVSNIWILGARDVW